MIRNVLILLGLFSVTALAFDNPFANVVDSVKGKVDEANKTVENKTNPKKELTSKNDFDVSVSVTASNEKLRRPYERDRDEKTVVLMVTPRKGETAAESIEAIESNLKFAGETATTEESRMRHMEKGVKGDNYYAAHTLTGISINSTIQCLTRLRNNEVELATSVHLSTYAKKSELVKKTEKARSKCLAMYRKAKPLYLIALERYFADIKARNSGSFTGYVSSYFEEHDVSYLDKKADVKVTGIFKKLGCRVPESVEEEVTCN